MGHPQEWEGHTGEARSKDAPRGAVAAVGLEAPGEVGRDALSSHLWAWGGDRHLQRHLRGWRRDRDPPSGCWGDVALRCPNAVLGKQACACPTSRSPWGRLSLPFPQGTPKIPSSQQLITLCFCDAQSSAETLPGPCSQAEKLYYQGCAGAQQS